MLIDSIVNFTPTGFAFSRDPLRVAVQAPAKLAVADASGETVMQAAIGANARVNISDALQEVALPLDVWANQYLYGTPVQMLINARSGGIADNEIIATSGGYTRGVVCALYGATPKDLLSKGVDIFEDRFLNRNENCFMTVRSSSRTIRVRETELEPLWYIAIDGDEPAATDLLNGTRHQYTGFGMDSYNLYAFNIARTRLNFFESTGYIPSALAIELSKGAAPITVIIEPAEVAPERHTLRFRNTFGAFERIDIPSPLREVRSWVEQDNATQYDDTTDSYITAPQRRAQRTAFEIDTDDIPPYRMPLYLDMLDSEEVYLLRNGNTAEPIRVTVTAADENVTYNPETAQKITRLTLKMEKV